MPVTFIRTVILYVLLTAVMRLMGKRQIGQLQPGELVITILISEIAAIPMQDNDIPLLNSVVAVLLLSSFEIITSVISMKSMKARSVLQGNSLIIIRNGELDLTQLRRMRYTVDDVLEALRQKDVFDISDVQYAVAETDGSLSVMLKSSKQPVTREDMNLPEKDEGIPCTVISDGRTVKNGFRDCGMTEQKLDDLIKSKQINPADVMLMTITKTGKINVIKKDGKK